MAGMDWLQIARDAYSASTRYFDASIRPEIEAGMRQFQGIHPAGSKYHSDAYRHKSRLFRPKTRAMVRKNEATAAEALFSTLDVLNVQGEDKNNPMQVAGALAMKAAMQYRLTKSIPWYLITLAAYQEAQVAGVVLSHQYWDYDARRKIDQPCVEMIPGENMRLDAAASWHDPINTSPYLIHLLPMYVMDVQARMTTEGSAMQPKWRSLSESEIRKAVKPYGDSTRLLREGQRTDSKDQESPITAFSVAWVHRNIVRHRGEDYVFHTMGTEAMLDEPRPLSEWIWHGKRPYVMGVASIEAFKLYPTSPARMNRDMQAEINEVANQRIDNVKLAMNKRWLVARNKQVDTRSLIRNVANSVTFVQDIEKDVAALDVPDVTSSSYQEQDRLNLDFDDLSGAFSSSSVQSNRRLNETVGGMNILTNNANQVSGYQLQTFVKTWVEPVLRQLTLLEAAYETDERVLALAGQSAQMVHQGVDAAVDELLAQELTLTVSVGISVTNPQEQVQQFVAVMTAIKEILMDGVLQNNGMKVSEFIKEIMGKLGYDDGSRFFDTNVEDPRIAQMQQTIDQLQAALDAKVDPRLLQAQVDKIYAEIEKMRVDAMKLGTDSAAAAVTAAETVAAVPETGAIADDILASAMSGAPYELDDVAPESGVERESAMKPEPMGAESE